MQVCKVMSTFFPMKEFCLLSDLIRLVDFSPVAAEPTCTQSCPRRRVRLTVIHLNNGYKLEMVSFISYQHLSSHHSQTGSISSQSHPLSNLLYQRFLQKPLPRQTPCHLGKHLRLNPSLLHRSSKHKQRIS